MANKISGESSNGYVRLSSLTTVIFSVIGLMSTAIYLFVSLSLSPMQKQIDDQEAQINAMRMQIVPRAEHLEKWSSQKDRDDELQRQIQENRSDLRSVFTPSDEIKDLADRIDRLERGNATRQTIARP